jgi:hypothetical protein
MEEISAEEMRRRIEELQHDTAPPEPVAGEPGVVRKRPDWLRPYASAATAKAYGVINPLLPQHLRGIRFRSFERTPAGERAWEKEAQKVAEMQRKLVQQHAVPRLEDDSDLGSSIARPTLRRGS